MPGERRDAVFRIGVSAGHDGSFTFEREQTSTIVKQPDDAGLIGIDANDLFAGPVLTQNYVGETAMVKFCEHTSFIPYLKHAVGVFK